MKKFLAKVLIFSLLSIVILGLLNKIVGNNIVDRYSFQYQEVFDPKVKADVIIIGSSHAVRGINPKYLENDNRKVFNFSFNGSNPKFYFYWYKNIFKPNYKNPKLIIFVVDWFMFDSKWLWRKYEQDSKYFNFSTFIKNLFCMSCDLDKHSLIFNRLEIIRNNEAYKYILTKKTDYGFELISKTYHGYTPFEARIMKKLGHGPKKAFFDKNYFEYFLILLDEFAKDKIPVVFINMPEYLEGSNSNDIETKMQQLNLIAKDRAILFYNYNTLKKTSLNFDKTLYKDWGHLNEKGAEKFSQLLKMDINSLLP